MQVMVSRVTKEPWTAELAKMLMDKYEIRFLGPLPSEDWPNEHKHLFCTVREIGFARYDDHQKDASISAMILQSTAKRIDVLNDIARDLRSETRTSEATWRDVEAIFKDIFCSSARW